MTSALFDLRPPSLLRRVLSGSVAIFLGQIISAISNIILVPLFLTTWGAERYGTWAALLSLVGYVSLANGGLLSYVSNEQRAAFAAQQIERYRIVQSSALVVSWVLCGIGAVLVVVLFVLPFEHWFNLQALQGNEVRLVLALLAAPVLLAIPAGIMGGTYRATGFLARGMWMNNLFFLLKFIAIFMALVLLRTEMWVALSIFGAWLIGQFAIWVDLKKNFQDFRAHFAHVSRATALALIKPSFFFLILNAATLFISEGSVLLLAATLGSATVAVYATTRTLTNLLQQMIGVFAAAVAPEITAYFAQGQATRLAQALRLMTALSLVMSSVFLGVFWFFGTELMVFWTKNTLTVDGALLRLMITYLALQTLWGASSQLLTSINRHRPVVLTTWVVAAVGLGCGWLSVENYGTMGLVGALTAIDCLCGLAIVIPLACQCAQQNTKQFMSRLLSGAFLSFVICLASGAIVQKVLSNVHWVVAGVLTGVVCTVLSSLLLNFLFLQSHDRVLVYDTLRRVAGRIRFALRG